MKLFSRRDFLKLGAIGLTSLAVRSRPTITFADFPKGELLGRVSVGKVDIKYRPDIDSPTRGVLYEDSVVVWLRELAGVNTFRSNQRWVETPDGYIWSPYLQPVRNQENLSAISLPESSAGPGMWVEVSVPYVDLLLDNPPARSPGYRTRIETGRPLRLYYSQVVWVDQIRTDEKNQTWYRINERYGSYGDILWGAGEAFRTIASREIEPINLKVDEKRIIVSIPFQTLSCFEGKTEVFFARISSGALYNNKGERVDAWATPVGRFPIWRKLISLHMSGGTTGGGWDLPGIGYTSLFVGSGVAIHSTFWHNNFGEPVSNGCVNARPDDAKWVFRWTQPAVEYDPGDKTVDWPGGTLVEVVNGW